MKPTILSFRGHSLTPKSSHLSPAQARADALVSSFVDHATDGYSLAAMVGGGLVYRLGRVGTLALGSRLFGVGAIHELPLQALVRYGSVGVGFTGEVFTFEAGQRALRVGFGGADPNLLRWSGENGLGRGLVGAAITLGSLKGTGTFVNGQNPVLQHLFQDSAMVLAHNVHDRIFSDRGTLQRAPTLMEQFVEAEAALWQMNAGMALVHGAFPTLGQVERSLDFSIRARVVGVAPRGHPISGTHGEVPLQSFNAPFPAIAGNVFGIKESPILPNYMMSEALARGEERSRFTPPVEPIRQKTGWMVDKIERMRREGYFLELFEEALIEGETLSPLERIYLTALEIEGVERKIGSAETIDDLVQVVLESRLLQWQGEKIVFGGHSKVTVLENLRALAEGKGGPQALSPLGSLRQKARDLIEREDLSRGERGGSESVDPDPWITESFERLQPMREELSQRIEDPPDGEGSREKEIIHEMLYQVLERGKPLRLVLGTGVGELDPAVKGYLSAFVEKARSYFPKEMEATVNPFTGERIVLPGEEGCLETLEARYRLARMLLNRHQGRPLIGIPSAREVAGLQEMVRSYLGVEAADFAQAQGLIRRDFDAFSPAARRMFINASPSERALLVEGYFGFSHHRELPLEKGFPLAAFLGSIGFYREIGLGYSLRDEKLRAVLTLGRLGSVSVEEGGQWMGLHTHVQELEGKIYLDGIPGDDNRLLIFSEMDVDAFLGFLRQEGAAQFLSERNPFYDAERGILKTYLASPFGIAELAIHLNAENKPYSLEMSVGKAPGFNESYNRYEKRGKKLEETIFEKHGVPLMTRYIPYEEMARRLPFPFDEPPH